MRNRGSLQIILDLPTSRYKEYIMPKLKRLGSNVTEVTDDNAEYLFSYDTCVGINPYESNNIYIDQCPVWGQESGISRTTARHIKKWLENRKPTYIDHDEFKRLASNLS